MAVDSRNKRFSLVGIGEDYLAVLPDPDGAVATADRLQFAYWYSGVAPGGGADTRNERFSFIGSAEPWNTVFPNPDGSLSIVFDRKQLLSMYRDEPQGAGIDTAAAARASGSAALTTGIPLAGSASALASMVSAVLTGTVQSLDGVAAAAATVTGALTTGIRLVGSAAGLAAGTGNFNRLPVPVGTPAPSFVEGTPSNYSVASFFTDPDGDAFIIVHSPGPDWPYAGISYDQPNKQFVYDGSDFGLGAGETLELTGERLIADDGYSFMGLGRVHGKVIGTLGSVDSAALASLAVAQATGIGALTSPNDLLAAGSAVATGTATLTTGAGFSTSAAALASASATLTSVMALAASAQAVATATPEMGGGAPALQVVAAGVASGSGNLTTGVFLNAAASSLAACIHAKLGPNPIFFAEARAVASAFPRLRAPGKKGSWVADDGSDSVWTKESSLEEV